MKVEQALNETIQVARRLNRQLSIDHMAQADVGWDICFTLKGWKSFRWGCTYVEDGLVQFDAYEFIPGRLTISTSKETEASKWILGLLLGKTRNDAGQLV